MRALGAIAQVSLQTAVRVILLPLVAVELGRGPKLQAVVMAVPRALVAVYIVFVLFLLIRKLIPVSSIGQRGMPSSMWAPIATAAVFEVAATVLWDGTSFRAVYGLTAGSIVLVAMAVLRVRRASQHRIDVALASFSTEEIREFVSSLPLDSDEVKNRLAAVSEEALMVLIQSDVYSYDANRQMRLTVTLSGATIETEFVAAPSGAQNLQERIIPPGTHHVAVRVRGERPGGGRRTRRRAAVVEPLRDVGDPPPVPGCGDHHRSGGCVVRGPPAALMVTPKLPVLPVLPVREVGRCTTL